MIAWAGSIGNGNRWIQDGGGADAEMRFQQVRGPLGIRQVETGHLGQGNAGGAGQEPGRPQIAAPDQAGPVRRPAPGIHRQEPAHLLAETEVGDQVDGGNAEIDGIVGADAEIEAGCEAAALALEPGALPLHPLVGAADARKSLGAPEGDQVRIYRGAVDAVQFGPVERGSRRQGHLGHVLQSLERPQGGGLGTAAPDPGMGYQDFSRIEVFGFARHGKGVLEGQRIVFPRLPGRG